MTAPIDIVNSALLEAGQRSTIAALTDSTPAAIAANAFYTPKTRMLMRTGNWDGLRAQVTLTQLKAAVINGVVQTEVPPSPFLYEYLYPPDCLKARFLLPTQTLTPSGVPLTTGVTAGQSYCQPPTGIPFVIATDTDSAGNNLKVILTNLYQAQLVYSRDLSQFPDLWDPMFQSADTALLAAYFINALARNKAQYDDQVAIVRDLVMQARVMSLNEGTNIQDHSPDWFQARQLGGIDWWGADSSSAPFGSVAGWDLCELPGGVSF